MALISREDCEEIDAVDPIAAKRSAFNLPPGVIYLDGNSLGALTHAAAHRVQEVVNTQWGGDLIKSWNLHGWIDQPRTLGRRLAPLLGVSADEVEVGDSTSVNLFKIAAAAARDRGSRYKIVTERGNFPTDPYILAGLAGLVPGVEVVQVSREALASALDPHTFLVVLTHVHYQSAEMFDLPQVTDSYTTPAQKFFGISPIRSGRSLWISPQRMPISPLAVATNTSTAAPARRPSCTFAAICRAP